MADIETCKQCKQSAKSYNTCIFCVEKFCPRCLSSRCIYRKTNKIYICKRCFKLKWPRILTSAEDHSIAYDHDVADKLLQYCISTYRTNFDWPASFPSVHCRLRLTSDDGVCLCILEELGAFTIVFRGTNNLTNLLVDVKATLLEFPGHPSVKMHYGFLKAYMKCRLEIFDFLIENYIPSMKLFITGHSMGGALASICIWDIYHHLLTRGQLIVFGSPKVGNELFITGLPEHSFFVQNALDPIPSLPPIGFEMNRHIVEYTSPTDFVVDPGHGILESFRRTFTDMFSHGIPEVHASYLGRSFPLTYNFK